MLRYIKRFILRTLARFGYYLVKEPLVGSAPAPDSSKTPASETKPGIFIITLPKSGSVFVQVAIQQTTGLAPMLPSHGYFPEDMLNVESMIKFTQGGHVAQSHCDPSQLNLRILNFFGIDWVLHLRDPRGALLSWTHHIERPDIRHKPSGHLRITPALPVMEFRSCPPRNYASGCRITRSSWRGCTLRRSSRATGSTWTKGGISLCSVPRPVSMGKREMQRSERYAWRR